MPDTPEWMSPTDRLILLLIDRHGNLTPLAIHERGGISRKYAGERCRELVKYGLLERISRGLYGITEEGEMFLEGKLDPNELEPDESRLED